MDEKDNTTTAAGAAADQQMADAVAAAVGTAYDANGKLRADHPLQRQFVTATPAELAQIPEKVKIDVLKEELLALLESSQSMLWREIDVARAAGIVMSDVVCVVATISQPVVTPEQRAEAKRLGRDRRVGTAWRKPFADGLVALARREEVYAPYEHVGLLLQQPAADGCVWIAVFDGGGARTWQLELD